jgi:hypothetical protein
MQENTGLRESMAQVAGSAAIAGVLMVLVGFWLGLTGISNSEVYNHSVTVFNWTMRIGGIAMFVIAALAYLGWRPVLAIDTVIAVTTGLLMVGVGLIWLINSDLLNGVLVLLFGGMFVRSGLNSWTLFRGSSPPEPASVVDPVPASVEERPISDRNEGEGLAASLRAARKRTEAKAERVAIPKAEEPDPEGFLADLGRSTDDDKP